MTLLDTHMDRFTRETLNGLVTDVTGPCISIYMPTERKGPETQQGPIRLKNLLTQTEEALAVLGERTPDIHELLAPAQALIDNTQFWQHQSTGLALLLSSDRMATYRLPLQFQETAIVSARFYLKPLLPMLTGDGAFYVLTLTQGGVHLFQGSRFSLVEIELGANVPKSLDEALQYDDFEKQLQLHTTSSPSIGGRRSAAIFHGQGGDEAETTEDILRFFHQLDNGVRDVIVVGEQRPLVLAGIDSLRGHYQQVNQYKSLVEEGVDSDPDALTTAELHERAWTIVEPLFAQAEQTALDRYLHLAGTNDERAVHTIEQIAPAAYFQRVDTLFMGQDGAIWGQFIPDENKIQLHQERQPGDEDLVNLAAIHTLLNGGDIYMVEPAMAPNGEALAAILRY